MGENVAASGGWDRSVTLWDRRSRAGDIQLLAPGSVVSMHIVGTLMLVNTASSKMALYDLRYTKENWFNMPWLKGMSGMSQQTRCGRISPEQKHVAISSAGGRVQVSPIDWYDSRKPLGDSGYTFTCHRSYDSKRALETMYAVRVC